VEEWTSNKPTVSQYERAPNKRKKLRSVQEGRWVKEEEITTQNRTTN
jgi:hypothetical protein